MRFARRCAVFSLLALLPLRAGAQTLFPPSIVAPGPPTATAPIPHPTKHPVPNVPQPGGSEPFIGAPTPDPYNSIILDNADTTLTMQDSITGDDITVARGNIRIRYRGDTLTSDRADIDLDRETVLFSGNVTLKTADGETVRGGNDGTLALGLRDGTYHVTGSTTTIPPQELGLGLILPVYVYGGTISGRPGLIDARGSQFTTCDFDDPHYAFGAKELYVVPGSHLVAKYVTYYRDGHREFTIPYLYIPFDRLRQSQIIPQVGETPAEGYFAKVAIGYALASTLPGLLNLEISQKQGIGTGIQQAYGSLNNPHDGSGVLSLYQLHDNSTGLQQFSYGLLHQQEIGTLGISLNTQGQENSSYVSDTQSLSNNTQLNLQRNVGGFNTTLQNNLTQNNYGSGLSQTLTSALDNIYQHGGTKLDTKFNYSDVTQPTSGIGSSDQQELDSDLDFTQTGKLADLEILTNKFSQLSGGTSTGYGGLERLPEVRLATDATRLKFLRDLLLPLQTKINISLGDFNEMSSKTNTQRALIGIDLGNTIKTQGRSQLNYGGVFQQTFYGDDTAQYTLNGHSSYQLRIGGKSNVGATYTYLRPYGYTPFQFDYQGRTNNAALNLTYKETRQFQLTLATAYDFNQDRSINGQTPLPWQNLAAQLLYTQGQLLQLQTTSAYDPNHGKLLSLTNNLSVRAPGGYALDLSAQYDPISHRFPQTNYSISIPFGRDKNPAEESGYRLQAIGGYNALTDQFLYQGLALTRDWHDWSASFVYQDDKTNVLQSGQTFTFNFQLKAFPAFQPFTIGQFGTGLSPGIGPVY
jgi:hypothetical protein